MRRSLVSLAVALGFLTAGCCCPRTCGPTACAPTACAPVASAPVRHDPCASSPAIERASGERIALAPTMVDVASAPYNETCPVMLGNPVDAKITTVWNGKTIGFCCQECRAKFLKAPEKYSKNLP